MPLRRVHDRLELQARERAAERVGVALRVEDAPVTRANHREVVRDRREIGERERGRLDDGVGVWLALLVVERRVLSEELLLLLVLRLLLALFARLLLLRRSHG